MWSLGATIWYLYEPEILDLAMLLFHEQQIPFSECTPDDMQELIRRLIVWEPGERLTAEEVLAFIDAASERIE
jgi:predicted GNAT family N-acyltransferase